MVVGYDVVACGTGLVVVGPIFSTTSGYGGLSSIATVVVVVKVSEPSNCGTGANISA